VDPKLEPRLAAEGQLVQAMSPWLDPETLELDNSASSNFVDRTFGLRATGDDDDAIIYYGNPAIAVTNQGDMGIVYMRAGKTVFPEARYSLYPGDGADILKSRLLKRGDFAITGNIDTGGAELDPDGETLWFVHAFGNASVNRSQFVISAVKP
jgi:hypothetical protein